MTRIMPPEKFRRYQRADIVGYQAISDLTTATGINPPAGATRAVIFADGGDIRWRDDGVDPTSTVGMLLRSTDEPMIYGGDLDAIRLLSGTASAGIVYEGDHQANLTVQPPTEEEPEPEPGGALEPDGIATLLLWLDAADEATITLNGSNVSAWADKSPNAVSFTQGTASWQPAYNSTDHYVTLDGTDDKLIGALTGLSGNPDLMLLAVVDQRSLPFLDGRFFNIGGAGNRVFYYCCGQDWLIRFGDGNEKYNAVTYPAKTLVAFTHPASGNYVSGAFYVNGTAQAATGSFADTNLPNVVSPCDCYVGPPAGQHTNMRIYEIIAFEDDTTDTRQKMEGYLAHKHGLEGSLPGGHPYKAAPPTA